jgi:CRISPR-associated protein Csm3
MNFEKLAQLIDIEVEYIARSSLAIHAGKETAFEATESPVVKIGGKPVIPGSSLKGVLRSTLEAILAQTGVEVCVPDAAIPNTVERGKEAAYAQSIGRKSACRTDHPCPVCQIFGTTAGRQGLSGRALFLDAKVLGEATLTERTHVAITRDTRSQAGGKLMSSEAVDAGAKFAGTIRLINPEPWQVGAILRALETMQYLGVGSKKTAGYGELDVRVIEILARKMEKGEWKESRVERAEFLAAFTAHIPQMPRRSEKK